MKSREEAVEEVESGDALAALILPADLVDEINSLSTLAPGTPKVEVLVNEENPLKAQAVDDKIDALLAQANLVIAKRVASEGGKYLNLLIEGGEFDGARQLDRNPRAEDDRRDPRSAAARGRAGSAAPGARPGDPLLLPRPRKPRRRPAPDPAPGAADRSREGGRQRRLAAARHLRDRRRRDPDPGLRRRPPGRRLAGARARGERLPAADPRASSRPPPCSPRRSCWGSRSAWS